MNLYHSDDLNGSNAEYKRNVPPHVQAARKLAPQGNWDNELLAIELQGLIDIDLDFDITFTGFEIGEIDVLLEGYSETFRRCRDIWKATA